MPICAAANKLKDEIENTGVEKLREIAKNRGPLKDMKEGEKLTQYEILLGCGVEDADIPSFTDPEFWLSYFPPRAKEDLLKFGVAVDLRRSFITTSVNPYYNSFIEWQFTKLKEKNVIKFGKRPSIYCVKDAQICADHDRSEGEGVVPQEYTLIKLRVCDKRGEQLFKTTESVYLVAATLRPETMYGQTNCFVLPTGVYACLG
jgi:leucyl-tRNA synthetase